MRNCISPCPDHDLNPVIMTQLPDKIPPTYRHMSEISLILLSAGRGWRVRHVWGVVPLYPTLLAALVVN